MLCRAVSLGFLEQAAAAGWRSVGSGNKSALAGRGVAGGVAAGIRLLAHTHTASPAQSDIVSLKGQRDLPKVQVCK